MKGLRELESRQAITRLGKGARESGMLAEDTMHRTIDAVEQFCGIAREYGITHPFIVGTEALRKAENARAFKDRLHQRTKAKLRILSGEEEARLSFAATASLVSASEDRTVGDLGGGSTDLAFGTDTEIRACRSMGIGCVPLSEAHSGDSRIARMQDAARSFFLKELTNWPHGNAFIVIGGTATSLAAVHLQLGTYSATQVQGHCLSRAWVHDFLQRFDEPAKAEILDRTCVSAGRLEVLDAGTAILLGLMQVLEHERVYVSDAGLRHAVLQDHFRQIQDGCG